MSRTSLSDIAAPFHASIHVLTMAIMCFPALDAERRDTMGWWPPNFPRTGMPSRFSHIYQVLMTRKWQPSSYALHHTICHRFERHYDVPPFFLPRVACHMASGQFDSITPTKSQLHDACAGLAQHISMASSWSYILYRTSTQYLGIEPQTLLLCWVVPNTSWLRIHFDGLVN